MKKFIATLAIVATLAVTGMVHAQAPPPPGHGQSGDQRPGGGAPIAGGLGILLALGAAYGAKKVYDARKDLRK